MKKTGRSALASFAGFIQLPGSGNSSQLLRTIFLLLTSLSLSQLIAQKSHQLHLTFRSGTALLTPENRQKIDSVLRFLGNEMKNYRITIVGHADSVGSPEVNYLMSLKRAEKTKSYITGKGFPAEAVTASGKGATAPVANNSTDANRARNRRVEISISKKPLHIDNIAGLRLLTQRKSIYTDKEEIFTTASGTEIFIPPDVFVDAAGRTVKGKVDIVYEEYRDPIDFMLSGIPMSIEHEGEAQQFNSAGMFKILASQNGEPVSLKPGQVLRMNFKQTQDIPGINFYRFDTLNRTWSERNEDRDCGKANTDYSQWSGSYERNSRRICDRFVSSRSEFIAEYGRNVLAGNESLYRQLLTMDTAGVFRAMALSDSLGQISDSIRKVSINNDRKIKVTTHKYKVYITESSKSKIQFWIKCLTTRNNELKKISYAISWKYKLGDKDKKLVSMLGRNTWTLCDITPDGDQYNISFENEKGKIHLDKVQLKLNITIPRGEREAFVKTMFDDHYEKKEQYLGELEELWTRKEILDTKAEELEEQLKPLHEHRLRHQALYLAIVNTPLYCFWLQNRSLMSAFERSLRFERWLMYFDTHHSEMQQRFAPRKEEQKVQAGSDILAGQNRQIEQSYNDQVGGMIRSLCLPVLGVYNLDALFRVNGEPIFAGFTSEEGDTLTPQIVFIMDRAANTVYRFTTVMANKTVSIGYVKNNMSRVLIIDRANHTYICNSAVFDGFEPAPLRQGIAQVLTVKKVENRDYLKKLLGL